MAPFVEVMKSADTNKYYDEKTKEKIKKRNRRKQKSKRLPGFLGYLEDRGILRVGMGMDLAFFLLIIVVIA
jgi:hypothetical protein